MQSSDKKDPKTKNTLIRYRKLKTMKVGAEIRKVRNEKHLDMIKQAKEKKCSYKSMKEKLY